MDERLAMLLDFYGSLLTDKQREALDMHINLDYSLSEIAENTGASRQAVLDSLARAKKRLNALENELGLLKKYDAVQQALAVLEAEANSEAAQAAALSIRIAWEDN